MRSILQLNQIYNIHAKNIVTSTIELKKLTYTTLYDSTLLIETNLLTNAYIRTQTLQMLQHT